MSAEDLMEELIALIAMETGRMEQQHGFLPDSSAVQVTGKGEEANRLFSRYQTLKEVTMLLNQFQNDIHGRHEAERGAWREFTKSLSGPPGTAKK